MQEDAFNLVQEFELVLTSLFVFGIIYHGRIKFELKNFSLTRI